MEGCATYNPNMVCLGVMHFAVCPDCQLEHTILYVDRKPIIYACTSKLWVWSAGEGEGVYR